MTAPSRLDPPRDPWPRRGLLLAAIAAGTAAVAGMADRAGAAIVLATIAASAAISVLRHLVNLEESR